MKVSVSCYENAPFASASQGPEGHGAFSAFTEGDGTGVFGVPRTVRGRAPHREAVVAVTPS